jgi:ribosomal protein S18 acetylase RimI-like enzyme
VDVEGDSVRGFVFGSVHPESVKRAALRGNPLATLAGILIGMSRRPSAAVWLLESFRGANANAFDHSAPELTYLAVSGESRGGGIGKQLVEAFTNEMRNAGAKSYELSVDEDNQAAVAFYERLGFTATGRYREFGTMHRRYRLMISTC